MKITLPLHLQRKIGGKKYALNMNSYRNNHFQINNWIKKTLKDIVLAEILSSKEWKGKKQLKTPLTVNYVLYLGNNRKSDLSNWLAVIDKFFLDSLTELGYIPDDNIDFVNEINFVFGGVDKNKARVEVIVVEST